MNRPNRRQVDDWKYDRIVDLGRKGNVTVAQMVERLSVSEHTVVRTLRAHGIEPYRKPHFSWTKWLAEQYAKDRAAGIKSGRRPPSYRR